MSLRPRSAYEAADRLPTDLAALSEQSKILEKTSKDASQHLKRIETAEQDSTQLNSRILEISEQAKAVLDGCHTAYAAATSVGLAKAFSDRANSLTLSMTAWVAGLITALSVAGWLGAKRLNALSSLLDNPSAPTASVVMSALMSALSIGAPVWFAWLATKQVGQQFRLAEDYSFKASIS